MGFMNQASASAVASEIRKVVRETQLYLYEISKRSALKVENTPGNT